MYVSPLGSANEPITYIAIDWESICAGRKEIAQFCPGTSIVTFESNQHSAARKLSGDDLSWWKPFLQLTASDCATGSDNVRRLFKQRQDRDTQNRPAYIDHCDDDVCLDPPIPRPRSTFFVSMRNRNAAAGASNCPSTAYASVSKEEKGSVVAEQVAVPVEFRFFSRSARTPTIVVC